MIERERVGYKTESRFSRLECFNIDAIELCVFWHSHSYVTSPFLNNDTVRHRCARIFW